MKAYGTFRGRKNCVVTADADMVAGVKFSAALADDNIAGNYRLAAEFFDAEAATTAVAAVAR
jgi:hypothetical protein